MDVLKFYFVVFLFFSIASCEQETMMMDEVETEVIDLGSFQLLEESIQQLPYLGKADIVFVDSIENEVTFKVVENDLIQTSATLFRYDVEMEGDTVTYVYGSESKSFRISNDSLDIHFQLSLAVQPYYSDPESKDVADVLRIYCDNPDPLITASSVFYDIVDIRTWQMGYSNVMYDQIDFIGRSFSDVLRTDYTEPISEVHFNYEFGLIAFIDFDNKLWRFERFD